MTTRQVTAAIGLGANVGDALPTLATAVRALAALPGVSGLRVSPLYRTRPVGVTDQPDFHNAVVALRVPAGPDPATGALALLSALKSLERALGRRSRARWGPRELDLDLLLFGHHRIHAERTPAARGEGAGRGGAQGQEVPHPASRERLFVLAPLADLSPALVPPGWPESVRAARDRRAREEGADAVHRIGRWSGATWTAR